MQLSRVKYAVIVVAVLAVTVWLFVCKDVAILCLGSGYHAVNLSDDFGAFLGIFKLQSLNLALATTAPDPGPAPSPAVFADATTAAFDCCW
jgi:hypothetical protein